MCKSECASADSASPLTRMYSSVSFMRLPEM